MAAAIVALIVAALVPSASAATSTKPALVTISPSSMTAGASASLNVSIKNQSDSQNLGSANITPPSGLHVSGVSIASGSSGSASVVGGVIQLRNLNLAPGNTVVVGGTVNATCSSSGGTWTLRIKQANDFNGTPGNDFTIANGSSITTTVSGNCVLLFAVQPTTAEIGSDITGTIGNPSGPDVQVGLYSSDGASPPQYTLITSFDGTVDLAVQGGTSGASVTPTSAGAVAGLATFDHLQVDRSGAEYNLLASVSDLGVSVKSDRFDVVDQFIPCTGSSCSGSESNGGTTGDVTANTSPSYLTISILAPGTIDCANYQEITGTLSWKTDDQGNQVGTITADSTLVKKLRPPDQGAAHFQVCFQPDAGKGSFTDRTGASVAYPNAGLLPDCRSSSDTNCVFFRNKTGAGSAVLKFRVADGKGRI